ncbi:hypothetical protein B0H13DRAFT_1852442 [Mycena leptocephala]|nr:hypothetical protein B0H13DRAFT_1852442 [Mycena leptocephala]
MVAVIENNAPLSFGTLVQARTSVAVKFSILGTAKKKSLVIDINRCGGGGGLEVVALGIMLGRVGGQTWFPARQFPTQEWCIWVLTQSRSEGEGCCCACYLRRREIILTKKWRAGWITDVRVHRGGRSVPQSGSLGRKTFESSRSHILRELEKGGAKSWSPINRVLRAQRTLQWAVGGFEAAGNHNTEVDRNDRPGCRILGTAYLDRDPGRFGQRN